MFKVRHAAMIFLSGCVWLAIGCFLLPLGLNFIVASLLRENVGQSYPILHFLSPYVGGMDQAALVWIGIALLIGFLKGWAVLAKSVQRSIRRILELPQPVSLAKIYAPSYYILLGSMFLIGFLVKFLPQDVRGGIDVAIGAALTYGAFLYFRQAWMVSRSTSNSHQLS